MNAANEPAADRMAIRRRVAALTVLGVLAIYGWLVIGHVWEPAVNDPAQQLYNLQADGFRAGQLNLLKPVPEGLARLPDPYDPAANAAFRAISDDGARLHDASYYKGKFYLYFGVTPILALFGPWLLLTGGHFPQELAVLFFCALGFVTSAWLHGRVAERFFPEASPAAVAAGLLALGFATGLPPLLLRPEVYEVAISCGYAFVMLALVLVWQAMDRRQGQVRWLTLASLCYGLAVAARPSVLFGAAILLVPVAQAWSEGPAARRAGCITKLIIAACGPVGVIGIGMMIFNARRFGSPFEFGMKYILASVDVRQSAHVFHPSFIGYNLKVYFFEPVVWQASSLFPIGINLPPPPAGYLGAENPFGVLTSVPFAVLAAALAFRAEQRAHFVWAVRMVLALFFAVAALICTFAGSATRYQVEFLPALMLLASWGLLSLERMTIGRRGWRLVARCGCGLLLGYSAAVGLLVGASAMSSYVRMKDRDMFALIDVGRGAEAIAWFETAVRRYPDKAGMNANLGLAYLKLGRLNEALASFERALKTDPEVDHVHNSIGIALDRAGRAAEARWHFMRALELNPNNAAAKGNLAGLERKLRIETTAPKERPGHR